MQTSQGLGLLVGLLAEELAVEHIAGVCAVVGGRYAKVGDGSVQVVVGSHVVEVGEVVGQLPGSYFWPGVLAPRWTVGVRQDLTRQLLLEGEVEAQIAADHLRVLLSRSVEWQQLHLHLAAAALAVVAADQGRDQHRADHVMGQPQEKAQGLL